MLLPYCHHKKYFLVNVSIVYSFDSRLVGCANNRFNLAVDKFAEHRSEILEEIRKVMKELSSPIAAAKCDI